MGLEIVKKDKGLEDKHPDLPVAALPGKEYLFETDPKTLARPPGMEFQILLYKEFAKAVEYYGSIFTAATVIFLSCNPWASMFMPSFRHKHQE